MSPDIQQLGAPGIRQKLFRTLHDIAVVVAGGMPFQKIGGNILDPFFGMSGAGVNDPCRAQNFLHIRRARTTAAQGTERIRHAAHGNTGGSFQIFAVFQNFFQHAHQRDLFQKRMGLGMAGDLLTVVQIERLVFLHGDVPLRALGTAQVECTLHAVFGKDLHQTAVMDIAVVVTEGECFLFSVFPYIFQQHGKISLSVIHRPHPSCVRQFCGLRGATRGTVRLPAP